MMEAQVKWFGILLVLNMINVEKYILTLEEKKRTSALPCYNLSSIVKSYLP